MNYTYIIIIVINIAVVVVVTVQSSQVDIRRHYTQSHIYMQTHFTQKELVVCIKAKPRAPEIETELNGRKKRNETKIK